MIIVNLKGGLGNQLFQYAFGRAVSLLSGQELFLDVSSLDRANANKDIYRPFSLGQFKIKAAQAESQQVARLKYPLGVLSKAWRFFSFRILRRMHIGWEPAQLRSRRNCYLDGFWQSYRYFENIRDMLLQELVLAHPSRDFLQLQQHIRSHQGVSLHIRRGDYVHNPKVLKLYGACSVEYYQTAMRHIEKRFPNVHYFVFSDDIAWVRENLLLNDRATFVSGSKLSDAEELILMSQCDHNIIANSTFSWWGAWLNTNPNKIVVAPDPWFDYNQKDFQFLMPHSWTRLTKK